MELPRHTTELAEIIIEVESDARDAEIALARCEGEVAALRDDIEVLAAEVAPRDETARQYAQDIAHATETATAARRTLYQLIDDEYKQLCATEQKPS